MLGSGLSCTCCGFGQESGDMDSHAVMQSSFTALKPTVLYLFITPLIFPRLQSFDISRCCVVGTLQYVAFSRLAFPLVTGIEGSSMLLYDL